MGWAIADAPPASTSAETAAIRQSMASPDRAYFLRSPRCRLAIASWRGGRRAPYNYTMSSIAPRPKAAGRPPTPIDLSRLRDLAALGLSADQIADRLGISRRTLFNRMAAEPQIRATMDAGLSEATEFCARTLLDMARERNLGALIFWLKTRGGFNVPKEAAPAVAVQIHIDATEAPVDFDHVDRLAARQAELLRGGPQCVLRPAILASVEEAAAP